MGVGRRRGLASHRPVSHLSQRGARSNARAVAALRGGAPYSTIRLRPASGRTLTAVEAGLAGTCISSPVRGEIIVRALLVGLRARAIRKRPGSVKVPTARFLMWRSMRTPSSSSTAETSFLGRPVDSDSDAISWVLVIASLSAVALRGGDAAMSGLSSSMMHREDGWILRRRAGAKAAPDGSARTRAPRRHWAKHRQASPCADGPPAAVGVPCCAAHPSCVCQAAELLSRACPLTGIVLSGAPSIDAAAVAGDPRRLVAVSAATLQNDRRSPSAAEAEAASSRGASGRHRGEAIGRMTVSSRQDDRIEQCEAAGDIMQGFGVESAFDYLVGKKLVSFAQAAEEQSEFAQTLPAFVLTQRRMSTPEDMRESFARGEHRLRDKAEAAAEEPEPSIENAKAIVERTRRPGFLKEQRFAPAPGPS